MSIREEWQLVAHSPDITPATGSVAQAIARRIRPGKAGERLPQRTLLAESVGVSSKGTVIKALKELEELGVIQLEIPPKGSRQPSRIVWALECPQDCLMDHNKGNAKTEKTHLERELEKLESEESEKATRPNPQTTTRPNPQTALTSINKRERSSLISIIEKTLESLEVKTDQHQALMNALVNDEELGKVQTRAEQLALKAEHDPQRYLAAIATREPWKLLPKEKPAQAPPDFSHLPRQLREAQKRKYKALAERAANDR